MKKDNDYQEIIFFVIGLIPVVWFAILSAPYMYDGLLNAVTNISEAMESPFTFVWCDESFRTVFIFLIIYICGIGIYYSNKKNYRRQEEYGSAKWANKRAVNKKYSDQDYSQNKLLTQNVKIGLDGKKHRRNLNTIVIGGSGAGKTRFYGKPNLMQCNTSYVCLDPKGQL